VNFVVSFKSYFVSLEFSFSPGEVSVHRGQLPMRSSVMGSSAHSSVRRLLLVLFY
jgi:hypothetical protein